MAGFKKPGLQYGTYYSGQTTSGPGGKSKFLIIGIIVVVLIGLAMGVTTLLSNNAKSDITLLAVKENSLLALTNASQASLTDDTARVANSNATILLTSDVASLVSVTGIKKLPDGLVKQYVDTNSDTLKQAQLLDKFDTTYEQIVLQKVNDLMVEAQTVQSKTTNKAWLAEVKQAVANLQSIQKQFQALSQ